MDCFTIYGTTKFGVDYICQKWHHRILPGDDITWHHHSSPYPQCVWGGGGHQAEVFYVANISLWGLTREQIRTIPCRERIYTVQGAYLYRAGCVSIPCRVYLYRAGCVSILCRERIYTVQGAYLYRAGCVSIPCRVYLCIPLCQPRTSAQCILWLNCISYVTYRISIDHKWWKHYQIQISKFSATNNVCLWDMQAQMLKRYSFGLKETNSQYCLHVECGSMWSVAACGVWLHVECGSMWSVAACGVWQHVECGSMWSVAACGVWLHVECGSMWSVAACGVTDIPTYVLCHWTACNATESTHHHLWNHTYCIEALRQVTSR
jgi:hypothetical protein